MKKIAIATAAVLVAATFSSSVLAVSPNEVAVTEASCLVTLGFTQGDDAAAGKDFYVVQQASTERTLGGKTIKVDSGNAAIRFASAILRSSEAMRIAAQCKYKRIAAAE
ncbi:MAG: hypothetical protein JKX80_02435 [Candidatus Pacebacteria bacterium]|nr:hypothetical protein [Candidatus Paceibacterota bacterium]